MRAALDVAMAKPVPVPEHILTLESRLRQELDRVERLLEGLLSLARSQRRPSAEEVTVALDQIASAGDRAPDIGDLGKRLDVDLEVSAEVWVSGSETLLSRMVENVIENAISHNQPGGWVASFLLSKGRWPAWSWRTAAACSCRKMSIGSPNRFDGLGTPRTGSQMGTGLGLSIVASIAHAHGGALDLHARRDGGLRVVIALPAAAGAEVGARR